MSSIQCAKQRVMRLFASAAIGGGIVMFVQQPGLAQKNYLDAFTAKYPALAPQIAARKCHVCHVCHGRLKTQRSDYARTLEAALGGKKIKNVAIINNALATAAAEKLKNGASFGDLLNAGKLPPPYPN